MDILTPEGLKKARNDVAVVLLIVGNLAILGILAALVVLTDIHPVAVGVMVVAMFLWSGAVVAIKNAPMGATRNE
jgi:hypothetical protein